MNNIIYLDYMATTPIDARVVAKMQPYLTEYFGNAASAHVYGYAANDAIEQARQQVADLLNADSQEIVWTSGATEANNLAIKGAALFYQRKGKHIITGKTEHKAVLDVCQFLEKFGFIITYLVPETDGLLDVNKFVNALRSDTVLASIMQVNNEIGVIQNIEAIGEITRKNGVILHVDAAQSAGKIPIDFKKLKVDLLSLSAHKMYGPKGIGALYVCQEPRIHLEPQIHGGGQEKGLRSGTLPTHQIVGFGEACAIAKQEMNKDNARILKLREKLWQGIKTLEDVYINGSYEKRVAHNLNVSFGRVDGESLLLGLKDIAVSSGSACTAATVEPSYVLKALQVPIALAYSSVRFSLGRFTTADEINRAIQHIHYVVNKLREMEPS